MWTTSSSPAERLRRVLACAGLLCASFRPVDAARLPPAPDSPGPALPAPEQRPRSVDTSQLQESVELRSVSVLRLDPELASLAGPHFLRTATDPLAIEVVPRTPFDTSPRGSAPVIVLNGRKLLHSLWAADTRLVAFLPDRQMIRTINSVEVFWLGNESLTRTDQPLYFSASEVPGSTRARRGRRRPILIFPTP